MVLVIIAILAAIALPSMQSAFTEQGLRADSHQLALMVKTAMIKTAEQHRNYVIDLTPTTMALHPAGVTAVDADDSTTTDDTGDAGASSLTNFEVTRNLDPANKLLGPDPQKANAWIDIPDNTEWAFVPGELCPAPRVRLTRGNAWIELSFNALTGNVENEASYLP